MRCYESMNEALVGTVDEVLYNGSLVEARGRNFYEACTVSFCITNPRDRVLQMDAREIRRPYLAASLAWNLDCRSDVDSICWWNPNGRAISDDGNYFRGANYGQRIMSPLKDAVKLLREDPSSRRAWVPVLDPTIDLGEYARTGKDVPCTVGFGMQVVDGGLQFKTVMRSQSVIGVMCYDVFLFTALQELIANELEVALGCYEHVMLSTHVFENEYEWAQKILDDDAVSEPMEPCSMTLEEAAEVLPRSFEAVMDGRKPESDDPFSELMAEADDVVV